jgi:hypothetical protein
VGDCLCHGRPVCRHNAAEGVGLQTGIAAP